MTRRPSVMSLDDLMPPKAEPAPEPIADAPSVQVPSIEKPAEVEPIEMEAREVERPPSAEAVEETPRKGGRKPVPEVFRTSLYFHRSVHDALREIAYDERLTISDLINEGIDLVLKGRGYSSATELKAKCARKRKR